MKPHARILARDVLLAGSADEKCEAAHKFRRLWLDGQLRTNSIELELPDRPSRPQEPRLVNPKDVPRRRLGTVEGRIALLHAVAHIEFNAIDLAADMVARYASPEVIGEENLDQFISDWSSVCDDEARHFGLVRKRLLDLGSDYGAHLAHDGLWQAAEATNKNVMARLAIAPMVLEARGLDVTPGMIGKLKKHKDYESADILEIIYDDEIGHVAFGKIWFAALGPSDDAKALSLFHMLVRKFYNGLLKPPFNFEARDLAGIPREYYEPLSMH